MPSTTSAIATPPAAHDAPAPGSARHVLVVEDSHTYRVMLERSLADHGYAVSTASDGVDAWKHLEREDIDLLLLDIEMPCCSGLKLLHILKGLPEWRDLRVIMLTGVRTRETILEAVKAGACDYVVKDGGVLEEVLKRVERWAPKAA
jgi:DNA-binding response OmpR family regulator